MAGYRSKVAFTLAFAVDPKLPKAVFFACQHHAPELFWKPEYQRHANGALGIEEVALIAADPCGLRVLFKTLTGASTLRAEADGLGAETRRGTVRALTPAAFTRRYAGATPPALSHGARFAGCRIRVEDLAALRELLIGAGIAFGEAEGALVIPPEEAFGFALGFVQRSKP